MERKLKVELLSWWQAGSGRGAGKVLDSTVHRSASGLPEIPGKTLKGLLRSAMDRAEAAGVVERGRSERWFGSFILGRQQALAPREGEEAGDAAARHLEKARFSTQPGVLWFGSAVLPRPWQEWASSLNNTGTECTGSPLYQLFSTVASTAIDENGVAAEHTLRVREVAVPMTLTATLIGPEDTAWPEDIQASLLFLHSLGTRRNRGYGRLRATLEGHHAH